MVFSRGGSFEVQISASDATAGLDQVTFPATTGDGAVYPQSGASSATVSHPYGFFPSSTEEGDYQVTVTDRAGNASDVPFTVVRDATTPTASLSVPGRTSVATVTVAWDGSDGAGSGIAGYDLEVSEDGVNWTRLLTDTQSSTFQFIGQFGHRYTFRARAADNVGNLGAWSGEATTVVVQVTKYYAFGAQRACPECNRRVAMRQGDVVYYLHGDHLGSTSVASTSGGAAVPGSRVSYYPYGETRTGDLAALPTDFGFTGQRLDGYIKLYDYHARFYDPLLGRFISADTIVPNPANPQDLNRYAYVRNNPLKYVDPTGHQGFTQYSWADDEGSGRSKGLWRTGCYYLARGREYDPDEPIRVSTPASEGMGLFLEMLLKPSTWGAVGRHIVGKSTEEELIESLDSAYEGTRIAVEGGIGIGDNWRGCGAGVSFNPDNTVDFGMGGSYGMFSAGVSPQDGAFSIKPVKVPVRGKTTMTPKFVADGSWGVSVKPPIGLSVKTGGNRYGNYMGVGYTHKVAPLSVSGEVTAYGGVVDRTVGPVFDKVSEGFWNVAGTCTQIAYIGSHYLLGPELTEQLFSPGQ